MRKVVLAILAFALLVSYGYSAEKDSLYVLFTGSFRGAVESCSHCPVSGGGIARRATVLKEKFGDSKPLTLDAGQFLDLDPEMGIYYSRCGLKSLREQGLQAALVTSRDLFYGTKFVLDVADSIGLKLVCANLVTKTDKTPVFEPWVVFNQNGKSIAVCGLMSFQPGRRVPGMGNWTEIKPQEALARLKESIPQRVDLRILLSDLSEAELHELLPLFPEIDIAVTSSRQVSSGNFFTIEGAGYSTLIVKPSPNGASLEGIAIPLSANLKLKQTQFFSLPLKSSISEDKTARQYLNKCLGR